jgi:protocatechuate 3,4-dioxygenase beta subunit
MTSMITRREFVGGLSLFLVGAPLVSWSAQKAGSVAAVDRSSGRLPYTDGFGSMPCSKCIAPPVMSPAITIAAPDEPGERMIISGTIFRPDGKTPAKGVVLYVYHTDATGYYSKDDDPYNPRLRGWMKTGDDGRYEFRSIKPAPYPRRDTPAHIHAQIYSDNIAEYGIDEYWFEGDPLINDTQKKKLLTGRGGFNPIIRLARDPSGLLRGTRDIKLDANP